MDSFLDRCSLEGVKLIPFATSGGSGISQAESRLRALYPQADWRGGRRIKRGGEAAWAAEAVK